MNQSYEGYNEGLTEEELKEIYNWVSIYPSEARFTRNKSIFLQISWMVKNGLG